MLALSQLRVRGQVLPASRAPRVTDHPPALALPIDVTLASVGGQLMGFHYQHLSVATVSALPSPPPPPPHPPPALRGVQSSKVGEKKALGSDS